MSEVGEDHQDEAELLARIAELEQEIGAHRAQKAAAAAVADRLVMFETILDCCPAYIYAKDAEGRYMVANREAAGLVGRTPEETLGKKDSDFFPKDLADTYDATDRQALSGATETFEESAVLHGSPRWVMTTKFPLRNASGQVFAACGITTDITDLREAETENKRLQEEMMRVQEQNLRARSSPLLPIAPGVVLMPLIGQLDTKRAQDIMQKLLHGISAHQASVVILDITGVPAVDTESAGALMQTARAAMLLGAEVILTGIQPQIAQTIVAIGIELEEVALRSTLQSGITYALNRFGRSRT